jgi:GTP-dependent phosphoenolpyruvate carboxykinase
VCKPKNAALQCLNPEPCFFAITSGLWGASNEMPWYTVRSEGLVSQRLKEFFR